MATLQEIIVLGIAFVCLLVGAILLYLHRDATDIIGGAILVGFAILVLMQKPTTEEEYHLAQLIQMTKEYFRDNMNEAYSSGMRAIISKRTDDLWRFTLMDIDEGFKINYWNIEISTKAMLKGHQFADRLDPDVLQFYERGNPSYSIVRDVLRDELEARGKAILEDEVMQMRIRQKSMADAPKEGRKP